METPAAPEAEPALATAVTAAQPAAETTVAAEPAAEVAIEVVPVVTSPSVTEESAPAASDTGAAQQSESTEEVTPAASV